MPQHNTIDIQAAQEGVSVADLLVLMLNESPTTQAAAKRLGVSQRTLYRYMREHGVQSVTKYEVEAQTA
jgi:transcriptional regulator of acetoin/glycerol metabolism